MQITTIFAGKNLRKFIFSVIPLLFFLFSLVVISKELHQVHIEEIKRQIAFIPLDRILLALLLTLAGYIVLTLYDVLSLHVIGKRLKYSQTAQVSFISTAISYNVGMTLLSSGSLRFRLYSRYGLLPIDVGKIIPLCSLTFWLGFLLIGSGIFSLGNVQLPDWIPLAPWGVRIVGVVMFLLVVAYLVLVVSGRQIKIAKLQFPLPRLPLALLQFVVSSADWLLAVGVFYVLLPHSVEGISFFTITGVFMAAQVFGIISNVPGGLGVLDSVLILYLSPLVGPQQSAAYVFAYRLFYYLLPFLVALIMLVIHEIKARAEIFERVPRFFFRGITTLIPPIFAALVFVGGIVLLFSGVTPEINQRMNLLIEVIPLPVIEMTHFLASCAGAMLLPLAYGLLKRKNAAYYLSLVMLLLGSLFSLTKALDYEEAITLFVMFLLLLPCRKYFYRETSLTSQFFSTEWIVAIAMTIITVLWLGFFSHKHVEYSSDLFWQVSLHGYAPRSLRATVGIMLVLLGSGIVMLIRSPKPSIALPGKKEMEQVRQILAEVEGTGGMLALLGDKELLFSPSGKSFLMYGISGRTWAVMGDPVGDKQEGRELLWRLKDLSDRYMGWPVLYEVGTANLSTYAEMGYSFFKIGEEAIVDLKNFSLEGKEAKKYRYTLNKLGSEGYRFTVLPSGEVNDHLQKLKQVSDAWLESKQAKEKGFSMGFFDEAYLKQTPCALVFKNDELVAFANIWRDGTGYELSVDLMRYLPSVSDNIMDYLFLNLFAWGKEQLFSRFNLGMAPLSGLENRALAPGWNKLGALIYQHGEVFYNFQGVRQYKEKFHPHWESRYIALPPRVGHYLIFIQIASLISGGLQGIVRK
jgi:phosphatidylglycerol lysyltransferase